MNGEQTKKFFTNASEIGQLWLQCEKSRHYGMSVLPTGNSKRGYESSSAMVYFSPKPENNCSRYFTMSDIFSCSQFLKRIWILCCNVDLVWLGLQPTIHIVWRFSFNRYSNCETSSLLGAATALIAVAIGRIMDSLFVEVIVKCLV